MRLTRRRLLLLALLVVSLTTAEVVALCHGVNGKAYTAYVAAVSFLAGGVLVPRRKDVDGG